MCLDDADYLKYRHEVGNALGATYDFPDYKPHVTLSYGIGSQYVDINQELSIPIVVSKEIVEDLDLNWADDKK